MGLFNVPICVELSSPRSSCLRGCLRHPQLPMRSSNFIHYSVLSLLSLLAAGTALATDLYFAATPADSLWDNAANWSLTDPNGAGAGAVPTASDHVLLYGTASPVLVQASAAADDLTIGTAGAGGSLTVEAGGDLTVADDMTLSVDDGGDGSSLTMDGGTLDVAGKLTVSAAGTGTLTMNDGTLTADWLDMSNDSTAHIQLNVGRFRLVHYR
jgi:hypothetical protein